MGFDIRLPIGLMFTLLGALLAVYGWMTRGSSSYVEHSLGLNVNAWWGLVLLGFGLALLCLAEIRRRRSLF